MRLEVKRVNAHMIEYEGETLSLAQWAKRYGQYPATVLHRLNAGWTVHEALVTPPYKNKEEYSKSA